MNIGRTDRQSIPWIFTNILVGILCVSIRIIDSVTLLRQGMQAVQLTFLLHCCLVISSLVCGNGENCSIMYTMCWSCPGVTSIAPIVYNKDQLTDLQKTVCTTCPEIISSLQQLGVFKRSKTRRLHRGGLACRRPSSTANHPEIEDTNDRSRDRMLITIKPTVSLTDLPTPLICVYINARSCRNKTASM